VLSWSLEGEDPRAQVIAQEVGGQGYFTLSVQPPAAPPAAAPIGRDLIFVVDTSCSMSGLPMETAKDAMRLALDNFRPNDDFQVIRFSQSASSLSRNPLPATAANIARGQGFIDRFHGSGGTEMLSGIRAALTMDSPDTTQRMRVVLFLTDGYIGNERDIFGEIQQHLGSSRLFSLGVGSSVNRYLLNGMARMGRGAVTYMGPGEEPDDVVRRFYERIAHPVVTDLEIDWGELAVNELVPARIPDLFLGQPITVFGRYDGRLQGRIEVRGKLGGQTLRLPIEIEPGDAQVEGRVLSSMWARGRITELLEHPHRELHLPPEEDPFALEVIELALDHSVMTQYTSFVAVDSQRVVDDDGNCRTIEVPVEMPAGVSYRGFEQEIQAGGSLGSLGGSVGFGAGGLGTRGSGMAGGGSGYGSGSGRALSMAAPPSKLSASRNPSEESVSYDEAERSEARVSRAAPVVMGALNRSVIDRVIRQQLPEIRACYEQQLLEDATLEGKVIVKFTIAADGSVAHAEIKSSTLANSELESCILKRFDELQFPSQNNGGIVIVSYPLGFKTTD
jgi:Ca-activated chloride channel family protein